jgi:hypothetical protein
MSLLTIFLTVLFFTLLTVAYIKGRQVVEDKAPENLVKFHFIMVAARFLFAVTAVGIYLLFADNREDTIHFAALIVGLYLAMIVATLIIKH